LKEWSIFHITASALKSSLMGNVAKDSVKISFLGLPRSEAAVLARELDVELWSCQFRLIQQLDQGERRGRPSVVAHSASRAGVPTLFEGASVRQPSTWFTKATQHLVHQNKIRKIREIHMGTSKNSYGMQSPASLG
jgi:hypothetical protein